MTDGLTTKEKEIIIERFEHVKQPPTPPAERGARIESEMFGRPANHPMPQPAEREERESCVTWKRLAHMALEGREIDDKHRAICEEHGLPVPERIREPALAVVREWILKRQNEDTCENGSPAQAVSFDELLDFIDTLSRARVVEGVSYERLTEDMKKLSKTSRAIYVEEDIPAGHRVHESMSKKIYRPGTASTS
jgi:hypothetical protein